MTVFGERNEFFKIEELKVPPHPDNSELPDVPELKSWAVRCYDQSVVEYSASEANLDERWLTFVEVIGYKWVYSGFSNAWCSQAITEVVARVKAGHIVEYRLVRES